jgi:hypothetical protein
MIKFYIFERLVYQGYSSQIYYHNTNVDIDQMAFAEEWFELLRSERVVLHSVSLPWNKMISNN